MALEAVLKEIQTHLPFANEDVENGPAETLSGRRGRKVQAIEALTRLKSRYRLDLLRSAVFIIVTGSQRDEFQAIATGEKFNLFSADPELFYNDLAGRVPESLYVGKEGVNNIFDVLGRHLEDKMMELDVLQYNQLIFKAKYARPARNVKEFTSIVKEAINEQMGSEVVGIQAVSSILNNAIERNHAGRTTSILLTTGDEKLVMDLLRDLGPRSRTVVVFAGKTSKTIKSVESALTIKEVTEESVKTTLDSIKNSFKK